MDPIEPMSTAISTAAAIDDNAINVVQIVDNDGG